MKNLFTIEWIKTGYRVSTWIFFGLYLVLVPLIFIFFRSFYLSIDGTEVELAQVLDLNPVSAWKFIPYFASYLIWLFVLLVVVNASADITHRIWKQHVIEGLSRNQILLSKFITILSIALAATISLFIIGAATAQYSGFGLTGEALGQAISGMLLYFLYVCGYMAAGFVINLFLKSTGFTLILMLLYAWIVEPLARYFDKSNVLNYLPVNCFNDLMRYPIPETLDFPVEQLPLEQALIGSFAWIAVFVALGWYHFKRTDL